MVAQAQMPIRRLLMDEIDWNDRLIAIKGGRGIGKTDFLLTRAKEIEEQDRLEQENAPKRRRKNSTPKRPCLYVNLNNFYFTENSLVTFAGEFDNCNSCLHGNTGASPSSRCQGTRR